MISSYQISPHLSARPPISNPARLLTSILIAIFLLSITTHAQDSGFGQPAPAKSKKSKHADAPAKPTDHPSIPPTLTIPAEPLGFSAPGPIYLGQRSSMASLDFLDESHLLFTFRVPGLLKRDSNFDDGNDSGERQVRALIISLPTGAIDADELWTLHDHERYLWPLADGHFLLRDGRELKLGDSTLKLKPILRFPGSLSTIGLDPLNKFLITNSDEPVTAPVTKPDPNSATTESDDPSQQTVADAAPTRTRDQSRSATPYQTVLRILDRLSGKVLLVSRVRAAVQLPINSTGYLEALRDHALVWSINLNYFSGGTKHIAYVDSTCLPTLEFVADSEFVATVCTDGNSTRLIALSINGGDHLWELTAPSGTIWPHLVRSANGLRVARESLAVNHPVNASSPLDTEDIKSQRVTVYDAATGHVALTASASPILDAGGNLAISPSARRIAILHAGSIEIFDLDPPPNLTPTP